MPKLRFRQSKTRKRRHMEMHQMQLHVRRRSLHSNDQTRSHRQTSSKRLPSRNKERSKSRRHRNSNRRRNRIASSQIFNLQKHHSVIPSNRTSKLTSTSRVLSYPLGVLSRLLPPSTSLYSPFFTQPARIQAPNQKTNPKQPFQHKTKDHFFHIQSTSAKKYVKFRKNSKKGRQKHAQLQFLMFQVLLVALNPCLKTVNAKW